MERDDFALVMKALSDPTRLKIISLLASHDFCVGALARQVNASEASVSQHLQVLRKAGLVSGQKRGYYTHYDVNRDIFDDIITGIGELVPQVAERKECLLNANIPHKKCVHLDKHRPRLK